MKRIAKKLLIITSIIFVSIIMTFMFIFTNPNLNSFFEKLAYTHDRSTFRQISYCDTLLFINNYSEKYSVCGSLFDKSSIDMDLEKILSRGSRLSEIAENNNEAFDYLLVDWLISSYFTNGEESLINDLKKSIAKFRAPGTSSMYFLALFSDNLLDQESIFGFIRAFEYMSNDPIVVKYDKKVLYNLYSILATFYLEIDDKENYKNIMKKAYDLTSK